MHGRYPVKCVATCALRTDSDSHDNPRLIVAIPAKDFWHPEKRRFGMDVYARLASLIACRGQQRADVTKAPEAAIGVAQA